MTTTYHSEDPAEFIEALRGILPEHYEELCVTKDFPLMPDYETYGRLQVAGMLRCITVTSHMLRLLVKSKSIKKQVVFG